MTEALVFSNRDEWLAARQKYNQVWIFGSVALMDVSTAGNPFSIAMLDAADLVLVSGSPRWRAARLGNAVYAVRTIRKLDGSRSTVYMHRAILPDAVEVDHWKHDGLDNRKAHLRRATSCENKHNMHVTGGSSGYKGVSRSRDKWRAYIGHRGKFHHLGCFDSAEDAALVYDAAARDLFREFAHPNFGEAVWP